MLLSIFSNETCSVVNRKRALSIMQSVKVITNVYVVHLFRNYSIHDCRFRVNYDHSALTLSRSLHDERKISPSLNFTFCYQVKLKMATLLFVIHHWLDIRDKYTIFGFAEFAERTNA